MGPAWSFQKASDYYCKCFCQDRVKIIKSSVYPGCVVIGLFVLARPPIGCSSENGADQDEEEPEGGQSHLAVGGHDDARHHQSAFDFLHAYLRNRRRTSALRWICSVDRVLSCVALLRAGKSRGTVLQVVIASRRTSCFQTSTSCPRIKEISLLIYNL